MAKGQLNGKQGVPQGRLKTRLRRMLVQQRRLLGM